MNDRDGFGRAPLSIIIPTLGRTEILWNTLRRLQPQLRGQDEILIIDQNLPPLRPPPPFDLRDGSMRFLATPIASLTRARNLGLQQSRHDRIVFLDDDIEPRGNLLQAFSEAADRHPRNILTGMVEQDDGDANLPGVGFVDLGSGEIRTDYTRPNRGRIPFFPGGLVLLRKSDLPPGMRFCTAFRGAAQGEEIDFALRCAQRGLGVISDPEIGIRHLKALSGGCRSEAFQRRFFLDEIHNRALFYGRHGNWWQARKFLARLRAFCEFHTRRSGGHRWGMLFRAAITSKCGFIAGAWLRFQDAAHLDSARCTDDR